ncbi:MAG: hypothetical protein J1E78_00880 [Muribaculaceae bacterium]|nr:hypothetical protein [Muribaculaceae bacterium]
MSKNHQHNHRHEKDDNEIGKSLIAEEKNNERRTTRNLNKLWIWLGVLVLVALLLWWIFVIGAAGMSDIDNNGV